MVESKGVFIENCFPLNACLLKTITNQKNLLHFRLIFIVPKNERQKGANIQAKRAKKNSQKCNPFPRISLLAVFFLIRFFINQPYTIYISNGIQTTRKMQLF